MKDKNGDPILVGSYVRLPDGKHAWVTAMNYGDVEQYVKVERDRGGFGFFTADQLVTVKPTELAKARKEGMRKTVAHVSAQAHARKR